MLVKLHRWQPKANRYRTQIFNLAEGVPYLDLVVSMDAVKKYLDPTMRQTIARTQVIDRILVSYDGTDNNGGYTGTVVEVFMSPRIERKYTTGPRLKGRGNSDIGKRPKGCICPQWELTGEHGDRCPAYSPNSGPLLHRVVNIPLPDDPIAQALHARIKAIEESGVLDDDRRDIDDWLTEE